MNSRVLQTAEILASVAVIVSLAVLIFEVRHNSNAIKRGNLLAQTAALDEGSEQFSEFRRLLISDRDLTDLWLRGSRGEAFDSIVADRFARFVSEWIIVLRNHYFRNKTVGNNEIAQYMVMRLSTAIREHPGVRREWTIWFRDVNDLTGFTEAVALELKGGEDDDY
jgi:hypothetical protein